MDAQVSDSKGFVTITPVIVRSARSVLESDSLSGILCINNSLWLADFWGSGCGGVALSRN